MDQVWCWPGRVFSYSVKSPEVLKNCLSKFVPKQCNPVAVHVSHPARILHDFSASPVAGLRVVVEFSPDQLAMGESGEWGVGLQFCLRDVEKGVKWTGVTGRVNTLFLH